MFDLFRSRAKAVRIMLGAMLTIVALSMLVYLIPGAGTPVGNSDDQVIAEIGKEPITVDQVDMQIRNLLQGAKVPPEMADSYVPQLIDQAIAARAMAYEAKRLGFEVTDADLADIIRSTQYGSLPPDQYSQYIQQQLNTSVPEFENGLRENAYLESLQSLAVRGRHCHLRGSGKRLQAAKRKDQVRIRRLGAAKDCRRCEADGCRAASLFRKK